MSSQYTKSSTPNGRTLRHYMRHSVVALKFFAIYIFIFDSCAFDLSRRLLDSGISSAALLIAINDKKSEDWIIYIYGDAHPDSKYPLAREASTWVICFSSLRRMINCKHN